jgi:thioredoxin 1
MKHITNAQFETEVLGSKGPVIVDFYTDGCQPCRALSPILQELEEESNGALRVVKIDAAEEAALASSFGVTAVPALFLFSDGKCVGQTLGLKSKNNLKKWVDDALRTVAASPN